jgi:cold shock protein
VLSGTVQFFNNQRGFGFIKRDDGDPDVFVHISAVEAAGLHPPQEGDRLSFDAQPGRGGKLQAANLKLID